MRYLSGHWREEIVSHPMGGFLSSPDIGNKIRGGVVWAGDNGRFANPVKYSDKRYLDWLAKQPGNCLFATAPDVVGSHEATVPMSLPMLKQIRREGRPAAFCAQDGATTDTMPWDEFDALFIGGTTKRKLGTMAGELCAEGTRRGKHVHMGRVNSFRRIRVAAAIGVDSVDGTFLRFGPDINLPKLINWLDRLNKERLLPL